MLHIQVTQRIININLYTIKEMKNINTTFNKLYNKYEYIRLIFIIIVITEFLGHKKFLG